MLSWTSNQRIVLMGIHPDDYKATGLAWRFEGEDTDTYLFVARLLFGSACGPSDFSRLSNAVRRMMYRKGYKGVVSYIDDIRFGL